MCKLHNKTIIMQVRLFTAALLLVSSLGSGLLMAQSGGGSIDIQGSRTKFTGTIQDATTIMAITSKNVDTKKGQTITIGRQRDGASPNLFQECVNSKEVLPKVIFKVFKPGDPTRYKIVTLTNATIVKVASRAPQPNTGHSGDKGHEMEDVSFTFSAINMQNFAGSTSTSDDWTTPNQ
jgi:type VI secretion system Hcp family effector